MSIRDFFEKFDNTCDPIGVTSFNWTAKGIGFGQFYFYFNEKDGYIHCENECMSRETIKEILNRMVDECVLDCPRDGDGLPANYNPK